MLLGAVVAGRRHWLKTLAYGTVAPTALFFVADSALYF
jgi:hypothetical protein